MLSLLHYKAITQRDEQDWQSEPHTSLDPLSLSNLLHTTYTILLLSQQKVNAFEAETWERHDQNTGKYTTTKSEQVISV